jgi:hypothetical protein
MAQRSKKDEPSTCQIKDCNEESSRSLPTKKLMAAFDNDRLDTSNRRTKLCKIHYREFKKATKKDRELDKLGRNYD